MQTEIIKIEGMACNHCTSAVISALGNTQGVTAVIVSLEEKQAEITYDLGKVSREQLVAIICDLGFDAK